MGRSLKDEIRRVRIERAKELLIDTDLPLHEISPLAGFAHPETMFRLLKRLTDRTPGEYREPAVPRSGDSPDYHAGN